MSVPALVIWLVTIGVALKVAFDHAPALHEQSQAVLSPGNLPLLYAALVFIKLLHEFGHAFACRRFGGEVHQMGVAFMYFSPVPYVDATSSWAFQSKWERIFVSSAGMIVELFVAALATFVWANTGDGVVHSLAYNMMFIASVTTLLFNANPLMRYDGYYILGDLLEMPNLQQRSMQMLRHLAETRLFGVRNSEPPTSKSGEATFLAFFGFAGWIYRLLLGISIALFISEHYLLFGVVLALICLYTMTAKPLIGLVGYLAKSPRLTRTRQRAVAVTVGVAAVLLLVLGWWPAPNRFRAPGVLRAEEFSELFTSTPGLLEEILAQPGSDVAVGQPLLRLVNQELELERAATRASLAQVIAQEERALDRAAAELGAIRSRREHVEKRLRRIEEQRRTLVLNAPHAGTWVSPRLEDHVGQWFPRGQLVGQVVQAAEFRFTAVISQEEAANLFSGRALQSQVRISGQAATDLPVRAVRVIPAQQQLLPSRALGWLGGGDVAVSQADPEGLRTAEPFFELRATVQAVGDVRLLHGRSGKIRLELQREPLLTQWYRKTRQLLQRRYQI
jgi:putative peptide zinc metalloprotease protein